MKFHSIKTKLTVMYAVIIFILITCISIAVGFISSNALLNKSVVSADRELTLLDEKLNLFTAKLESESLYLTQVQDNTYSEDPYQQFLYTSGILSFLHDFIIVQSSVDSIAFYDVNGSYMFSDARSNISSVQQKSVDYIEEFKAEDASSKWYGFHYFDDPQSLSSPQWVCSFLRKIYSFRGELIGIMELNLTEESIQSIYDTVIADHYNFYILDSNQTIISAEDKSLLHRDLKELQQMYPPFSKGSFLNASDTYLYTTHKNEILGWTLVSTLPLEAILKESRTLVMTIFFIGFLALLLGFILLHSITNFIIRPLLHLTDAVERIAQGDYTVRADTGPENEIGCLASRVNSMAENTLQLLDTIEKESSLKRQFEFSYIQLQMSPHFLYNTLETICGMIAVDEKQKAIKTIQNVSLFYSKVLSKGIPIIPISQELEITRCYLDILQQRYCEIYTYSITLEPEAAQYKIPKLTLQPFVENALIHGIIPTGKNGHITVCVTYEKDSCIISISDNGAGIDEQRLGILRNSLSHQNFGQESASGFGIVSTYQRLLLFLGADNVTIELESALGKGTSIRLILKHQGEEISKKENLSYDLSCTNRR
ncbi:MAG: histidine kinase [Clostridiales bacterium]|nr:histidine kinase [Clostridiales bacterium]